MTRGFGPRNGGSIPPSPASIRPACMANICSYAELPGRATPRRRPGGRSRLAVVRRDPSPAWDVRQRRRQSAFSASGSRIWGISVEHFDPHWAARNRVGRTVTTARRDPGRAFDLLAREPEATALPRRPEAPDLRALRSGRHLAWAAHGADPRPHQRRRHRQPDRESPHRLPELCRNPRYPLRPQHAASAKIASCADAASEFSPRYAKQRHCSLECGVRHDRTRLRGPRPHTRKVERPSHDQLVADLSHMSCVAVGRKYGVSDNAVRKWLRWYEREREPRERTTRPRRGAIRRYAQDSMAEPFTVLIMAAGRGTRMRSELPKVLHRVCGKPMLEWVVDAGREAGAEPDRLRGQARRRGGRGPAGGRRAGRADRGRGHRIGRAGGPLGARVRRRTGGRARPAITRSCRRST